jgi:hypothetical protein
MPRVFVCFAVLLLLAVLLGCGGGGVDTGTMSFHGRTESGNP